MEVCDRQDAVSSALSVLLLVLVTLVVGVLLYNVVMGTMGNLTEPSGQPFSLLIENIAINDTCITVHIRNACGRDITIDKAYVNKELCQVVSTTGGVISNNSTGHVYLPGTYHQGGLYEVKLVCTSGRTLLSIQRY